MNRHGSIVFSLLLVLVFSALGAALLLRSANENKAAMRTANSAQAFWLAEAGAQKVRWEYASNSCAGMRRQDTNAACTNCTCGGVTKTLAVTVSGAGDIDATLNSANTLLQSTGSVPSRTSTAKVTRAVQGAFGGSPMFGYAAFSKGSIIMSNSSMIDSYNSALGAYGVNGNVGNNGDVGTNGTTSGIISMTNSSIIKGDASTGSGGSISLANSSSVAGSVSNSNNVTIPDVTVPSSLTSLSSSGDINLYNSLTQTITAGTYKYGQINLSNSAVLTISGNVTLYMTGGINISNSTRIDIASGSSLTIYTNSGINLSNSSTINNTTQVPSNLLIYSTSTSGLNMPNSTVLYGGIYMPNADLNISNSAQIYGAVVAKSVNMPNSTQIHYDEALGSLVNGFGATSSGTLSNWQEI